MLILSRKEGERIFINNDIEITILKIQGKRVHVGFETNEGYNIYRDNNKQKDKKEKDYITNGRNKNN